MRRARFLLRFDDICPTMNWANWAAVEQQLSDVGARPLLAVVPDNRDPQLQVDPPNPAFWDRVRSWQRRGWTIAVHGFQHLYTTRDGGLLGLHHGSEFAGLSATEQTQKLRAALGVFERESVVPEAWIAPGHSFDAATLRSLRECGLRVVSDGFSLFPFTDELGLTWIPQQLWSLSPRPFGVWTVCHHANELTPQTLAAFGAQLGRYRGVITSVPELLHDFQGRRRTVADSIASWLLLRVLRGRRQLRKRLGPPPGHGASPSDRLNQFSGPPAC